VKHRLSNVIGFDDAPFPHEHRGDVRIVGAVYAALRFDGVLLGRVRRDGSNAASNIAQLVADSKFAEHVQLLMLQGIALGGFNVVDVHYLSRHLEIPVLVVARRAPDMDAIKRALLNHVPGGDHKWALIERLGPMEPVGSVFVQRVGLSLEQARQTIDQLAIYSNIPEPLRTAHLFAGALALGQSQGRP